MPPSFPRGISRPRLPSLQAGAHSSAGRGGVALPLPSPDTLCFLQALIPCLRSQKV